MQELHRKPSMIFSVSIFCPVPPDFDITLAIATYNFMKTLSVLLLPIPDGILLSRC